MTSNEEIYLSSLCDRIMAFCNRLNKKLDEYDEFPSSYTTPVISYHEQSSWHVATAVAQPRPPPDTPNGQSWNYVQPDYQQSYHSLPRQPTCWDPPAQRQALSAAPPSYPIDGYRPSSIAYQQQNHTRLRQTTCSDLPIHQQLLEYQLYGQPPARPPSYWEPMLTATTAVNPPHQNYQPVEQQPYTGEPDPAPLYGASTYGLPGAQTQKQAPIQPAGQPSDTEQPATGSCPLTSHHCSAAPLPAVVVPPYRSGPMEVIIVPDEAVVVEEVQDKCNSEVMLFNRKSYGRDEMLMVAPSPLDAISLPCIPDIVGEEETLVDNEEENGSTKEVKKMVALFNVAKKEHIELMTWFKSNMNGNVVTSIQIICGGAVNDGNYTELASQPNLDGFFVVEKLYEGRNSLVLCPFDPGGYASRSFCYRRSSLLLDFHLEDKVIFNRGGVDTCISI